MSISDDQPFQLSYVSRLVPGTSEQAISASSVLSRQRNLAAGISGALLFDGGRFCQLLEGQEVDVRELMARINVDLRHDGVYVTAEGYYGLPRLMTHWRSGHCAPLSMEALMSTPIERGEVALALFMSALASASVE